MEIDRVALGDSGALGSLYDAHTDRILGRSLFKTTIIPTEAIRVEEQPSTTYVLTTNDSLDEKFSKLEVSAELRASVLGGIVNIGGSGSYLSDVKTSVQVQQASVICNRTTKTEHLHLSHNALKEIVDVQALEVEGVTHVISTIEWGSRCVITAKSARSTANDEMEVRGELDNDAKREEGNHKYSVVELLKSIGEVHGSGKLHTGLRFKADSSLFEFKINADFVVDNAFAINYEGVCKFIEGIPAALQRSNGGKGVRLKYHLMPIKQVAQIFAVRIEANYLLKQVDEDCLQRFVELFDAFSVTHQRLNDYLHLLDNHSFCVPASHRKATKNVMRKAKDAEILLKAKFSTALKDVRKGEKEMSALWDILKEHGIGADSSDEEDSFSAGSHDEYLSILSKFREKMDFADKLKSMGARYVPNTPEQIDNNVMEGLIDDVYILHFSESSRSHPQWANTRNVLMDLLRDMDRKDIDYRVTVVDYDMTIVKPTKHTVKQTQQLEKPLIQKLRGNEVIVNDVVADLQELAGRSLMRCIGGRKVEKVFALPAGRRCVRMTCPGKHCSGPTRHDWICPSCKAHICFGYSDNFMYCHCGRYLYSDAEYKCNGRMHGSRYAKNENEAHLLGCLKALDPFEEYNILILGETGIGKSTFINSFLSYVLFESLDEALRDPEPVPFEIPFKFTYQDPEDKICYEVQSGMENEDEFFSEEGQSGTQYPRDYVFYIEGRIFRFIDTPGIGDTRGVARDYENINNILAILDGVKKISMILFLLKPDDARLTPALNFCMTELLSHLHKDATKNIVFGFPKSKETSYTLGATRTPLMTILKDQQTGIELGIDNTYFFDAIGFKFLAAYKILGREMPDKNLAEQSWVRSSSDARRLLSHAMSLPNHDVSKTLGVNRIRSVIANMTEPMLAVSTAIKINMGNLAKQEKEAANLDPQTKNRPKEFWVTRTEPVRYNLDKPQTVCAHSSCSRVERDGDSTVTVYTKVCHDNCFQVPVDSIQGHESLRKCSVFYFLWFIPQISCRSCSHGSIWHIHISYVMKLEEVTTMDFLKIEEHVKKLKAECNQLKKEEVQLQEALAIFWIYMEKNAMTKYNDAIGTYLDQMIAQATKGGTSKDLARYEEQKSVYEEQKKIMQSVVERDSTKVPSEEDLEDIMEKLFSMPLNGQKLQNIISPNSRLIGPPGQSVRASTRWRKFRRFLF